MTYEDVFNRYDIRGEWPDEIDPAFAERLGKAIGTYRLREQRFKVVVGHDTREHSRTAHEQLVEGLRSTGVEVIDVGLSTTDRVGLACQYHGALGVMVTASHHRWERTGFKLLYEQGYGFGNEDLGEVKDVFREQDFETGDGVVMGAEAEFTEEYLDRAEEYLEGFDGDCDHIIVDCCNGGAVSIAPMLFEELGIETTLVNDERTGEDCEPEPGEDSREEVAERLREEGADLAVGYDPDADRVYCIHPELGWIDGDRLFYLLARITGAGRITASIDTSPMIEELDAEVDYTRVGDVFVSAQGYEDDADLLGEPNGHYAMTDFCWYNSGVVASALLALHHDDIEELLGPVQEYRTERCVYHLEDGQEKEAAMQEVLKQVAIRYEVGSRVDGVQFRTDDGLTCLVRPSGTSPKLRLIVHGTGGDLEERAEEVRSHVFSGLSGP